MCKGACACVEPGGPLCDGCEAETEAPDGYTRSSNGASYVEGDPLRQDLNWMLVERYVAHYPDDWRLIFRRGDDVLEVPVPEEVWRAFD